jgi:hypothetical protein
MIPRTSTIYSCTAASGADAAANWYATNDNDPRTHIPVEVVISGTSATVLIEGRNDPAGPAITLATLSASDIVMVAKTAQIHINRSAATTATIKATADRPLKQV